MGNFFKKHKKGIRILAVVLVATVLLLIRLNSKANQLPVVTLAAAEQSDLVNVVSLTGTIESEHSKKVYTSLTLPIDQNLVVVGDRVKEGDVLCQLDTKSLENTLAQQQASVGAQSAANQNAIAMTQKQYDQAVEDIETENNAAIFQAEQTLIQAEQALEKAEIAMDSAVDDIQYYRGKNVDSFGVVYPDGDQDRDKNYAVTQYSNARDIAYANYEAAKQGVDDAKLALEIAKHQSKQQLESLEDSIKTNQIAAGSVNASYVSIDQLQEDIAKGEITSPVSGVITAVYVTEGAPSTGLLYVIEDVDSLKVTANLKEYDLSLVTEGNDVEIKSDATGEEVFQGKLSSIAPTTTKTPAGDNVTGVSGEFETEIAVDAKKTGLRIGTKARMDIIYDKKEQVLNVNHESVGSKIIAGEPSTVVYVLEEEVSGSGIYTLVAKSVTLGLETDMKFEILSGEIKKGDIIVADATGLEEGSRVQLPEGMTLESFKESQGEAIPESENQEG